MARAWESKKAGRRAVKGIRQPLLAAFVLLGLSLASLQFCTSRPEERSVSRRVPSPILFVHGLGGSAETWKQAGLTAYLQLRKLKYGGVVRISEDGQVELGKAPDADFFLVEISPPFQSLQAWQEAIGKAVAAVRKETGASRVVLVGHSAGGLAGRKYLVDHLHDHSVAKLVTVASPHRGSELALLSLLKKAIQDGSARDRMGSTAFRLLDGRLSKIERAVGIPLDAPLLSDLLPESRNPKLAELNRSAHPEDLEYACVLAVGSADAATLNTLSQLDIEKLLEEIRTRSMSIAASREGLNSIRGDGAVLVASQDLRAVEYFRGRKSLVEECPAVDVEHHKVNEQHRVLVSSTESPIRFLRARRVGAGSNTSVQVDFHDYFAGLVATSAQSSESRRPLPVASLKVIERETEEGFGRVTIGPFDGESISGIDLVIQSFDRKRRYGRRILLDDESNLAQPVGGKPRPITVTLTRVDGVPTERPWYLPKILDLSSPEIHVVLSVDRQEVLRSRTRVGATGSAPLGGTVDLDEDPREAEVTLDVLAICTLTERIGRVVWHPGEFPRSSTVAETENGIKIGLQVVGSNDERILWDGRPILATPSR